MTGWNAINNWVNVSAPKGSECTASTWLRTSDILTDGYMTIRDGDRDNGSARIIHEIKLVGTSSLGGGNIKEYRLESFDFKMGALGKVLLDMGFQGSVKMLGYKSMLLPLLAERLFSTIANLADQVEHHKH